MLAILLLLACDKPCAGLDSKECVAREDCARTRAYDWCTNETIYGGCRVNTGGGCPYTWTSGALFEGNCLGYDDGCMPAGLEPCVSECDESYADTGTY
jgi:hypothetical protein